METLVRVEETLDRPWSVPAMASIAGLSPSRFAHVFRDTVGEAPAEYLARLRLERAAMHLVYADWPVTDVALAAGYTSHAGFTHAFTARFGVAPTTLRERLRAVPFLRGWSSPRNAHARAHRRTAGSELEVEVVREPAFRVAFVRQWGGFVPFPRAWLALAEWARSRGLAGPDARPIGCNYDDLRFTPPERMRYDAGLVVGPDFDPRGEVPVREVPAGLVARTRFEGTVIGLGRAWDRFVGEWLPLGGYQPRTLFAYDLHPAALLARMPLAIAARMTLAVRSTLCIPVQPGDSPPADLWAGKVADADEEPEP